MVNRFYVEPAVGGILQGLGSSLSSYTQRKQAEGLAERSAAQDARESALLDSVSTGDTKAIFDLMQTNPDLAASAIKGSGYQDDRQRAMTAQSMANYLAGGDAEDAVKVQAEILKQNNQDPSNVLRWGMMPEGEEKRKMAEMVLAMNATPDQWGQYQSASGRMTEAEAGKFNIEREKLDMRRLENEQRALDRQYNRETNNIKREELKLKIDERKTKLDEKKQNISSALSKKQAGIKSTQRLIDDMLAHEGLNSAVGLSSVFPTIPGGDSADYEVMLETLKSQQFLNEIQQMKGMGALSNAEGQKISAAAEALSLAQSEDEHRKALKRIKEGLQTIAEPGTYGGQGQQATQSNTVNWADM